MNKAATPLQRTVSRRVMILGTGPLPTEGDNYTFGSSARTWHFAKGLVNAGHRVHVLSFRPTRLEQGQRVLDPEVREYQQDNLSHLSVEYTLHFMNDNFLHGEIDRFQPEVLIGVNAFPAGRASSLGLDIPVWADLNGFNMGEVQVRAHQTRNELAIIQGWCEEFPALCHADMFSAASHPQRYALIGELAALGRLSGECCGYEFVHVIPNAREEVPPPMDMSGLTIPELPSGAFLALWVGAFNYHFDLETLFRGVEEAMEQVPELHFVLTGGKVDAHNESLHQNFMGWIENSRHRKRWHAMGWLPFEQFNALIHRADLGVTLDVPCYETELGARNRITDMLRVGLPVLTTYGPEITMAVMEHHAGWAIPPRSPKLLAETLMEIIKSKEERVLRGRYGRDLFLKKYTLQASLQPLLQWLENPVLAPDHGEQPLLVAKKEEPPPSPSPGNLWERLQHWFR